MSYEMVKTSKKDQSARITEKRVFDPVSLLIACFCSIERVLWSNEDSYSAELDVCETAEILLEDGLEAGAEYNYNINQLFSNYPLSVQGHFERCVRCRSRLLELIQFYYRAQSFDELNRVIELYQADLEKYPTQEFAAYHAAVHNNLGNALLARFERQSEASDLHQALRAYQQAVHFYTPRAEPLALAEVMNNIATALLNYACLNDQAQPLTQAIEYYRDALAVFKHNDCQIHRALVQNNLGNAHLQRFERYKQPEDLEQALVNYRVALETCQAPLYPTQRALLERNYGGALLKQYQQSGYPADWEKAYNFYQKSLDYFSQYNQFDYDTTLASEGMNWLFKYRTRAVRMYTDVTVLDKNTSTLQYTVGNGILGIFRPAGMLEVQASVSWHRTEKASSFEADDNIQVSEKYFLKLQPLLVRSSQLRLRVTLPDTQSEMAVLSTGREYRSWTSAWHKVEGTNPIEIEVLDIAHLARCRELHWEIEGAPLLYTGEWASGYLTWGSLLGKLANSQYYLSRLRFLPSQGWLFEAPDGKSFELLKNQEYPKTSFELINLSEQGIKLEVESQRFDENEIRLLLRLISTGVTTEQDPSPLNQLYEISVLDHEQTGLLGPTRLKVGQEQTLTLVIPDELEDWTNLEFKIRKSSNN